MAAPDQPARVQHCYSIVNQPKQRAASVVILEDNAELDELQVFLPVAARSQAWQTKGDIKIQALPDGTVTAMMLHGYRRWVHNRMVLVDLIARTMQLHRDQVVDDVNALFS
jgi:hypothetical protein